MKISVGDSYDSFEVSIDSQIYSFDQEETHEELLTLLRDLVERVYDEKINPYTDIDYEYEESL